MVLLINQADQSDSLKAGRMAGRLAEMVCKQHEWHESCTTSRMARNLAEQTAHGPNSMKAVRTIYKRIQARKSCKQDPTSPSVDHVDTELALVDLI